MKSKLLIHSQYKENYAAHDWDGVGDCPQSWKSKGGHTFEIEVDSDVIMYSTNLESHLQMVVANQCNTFEKFEYIGYELELAKPSKLDSELLYSLINEE